MQINLNDFGLNELLKLQAHISKNHLKKIEQQFIAFHLKKERIDQKLKKTERKQLLNFVCDSICQKKKEKIPFWEITMILLI